MTTKLTDLLSASAVRHYCDKIGQAAEQGATQWFVFEPAALDECITLVANECLSNYPDLAIPCHSRWRHFVVGDTDLWQHYRGQYLKHLDSAAVTRSAIDFIFVSVLLDAGAGDQWQYKDPVSKRTLNRSEGLAAASMDFFFHHLAQPDSNREFGVTVNQLQQCTEQVLASAFQHDGDNPLVGIAGRTKLLRGLGATLARLAESGFRRPGHLYDRICVARPGNSIAAGEVLEMVLGLFNNIWPDGMVKDGVHLGDCGRHTLIDNDENLHQIVPFHKLSQWLTYSLLEPLQWAGIEITDLDQLTGLPEYRNGGLLIDTHVLRLKNPSLANESLALSSEPVVEWRALTVWLLDRIARGVRKELGMTTETLPLASVLQGGTWSAGRKLARKKRGGLPPLKLDIKGTVF